MNIKTILVDDEPLAVAELQAMLKNHDDIEVVAVSYDYTLVSNDFGNSWTYYRNGLLDGGNWNFIWLDDNTLVNVTQEYADVIKIE